MGWYINLKIRTKLVMAFFVVALISMAVGAVGTYNINTLTIANTQMYNEMVKPLETMNQISINFQQVRIQILDLVIDHDLKKSVEKRVQISASRAKIADSKAKLETFNLNDEMKGLINKFNEDNKAFDDAADYVVVDAALGLTDKAMAAWTEILNPQSENLKDCIEKINSFIETDAGTISARNAQLAQKSTFFMLILSGGAFILSIALGLLIARVVGKPLRKLKMLHKRWQEARLTLLLNLKQRTKLVN